MINDHKTQGEWKIHLTMTINSISSKDFDNVPYNTEEIRHTYKSKYNLTRKNRIILLIITDDKKGHCLAVKSMSALFRGITSKYNEDVYCLNCFH